MTEPNTETTQTAPAPETNAPVATPEQGTAGAPPTTPAPSKTNEGQKTQEQTTQPPVDEVQKRIDRMYARLQDERKKRVAAEAQAKLSQRPRIESEDQEEEAEKPQITEADVQRAAEQAIERKEKEKRFMDSEVRVFKDHPTALTADGNFNMEDPWVKRYIEIGKQNPMLAMIENGPELAAAMVDKELGVDFKKGRITEAQRSSQADQSFTTSSTVMPAPAGAEVKLSEVEQKIARRMGMTNKEYADGRTTNKIKQTSWEPKRGA